MNAIALCHNRDLQKTNGRIIVLGTGSISLMETATRVNMQPYSQSKWFVLHLDGVMVCLSLCLQSMSVYPVCLYMLTAVSPSIRLSLSRAVMLGSTRSPKWLRTDVVFCFWSKQPNQWSFFFFFAIQHASLRRGALLCSLLTVKSWENCPEILSKKECK